VIEPSGAALFRILGPVEVWTGQDWAEISAGKQRSVLATLLLRPGEVVSTDALIDQVWPDQPPARAANLVSVYVHHLRRLIGDAGGRVLVTRAPGYQVVPAPGELDADRFAALVGEGRQALASGVPALAVDLLDEAVALWRGRALADVPATPLVAAEADRLEESRIEALELRAEASLACGRYAEVVPEVRRLLVDHPLREKLWALLIRALYGAGRQAEALEVYEQARNRISDELGVDPGVELRQLYHQILNADDDQPVGPLAPAAPGPVLAPAPMPAQLPADIPDFTGRSEQVSQLRELLTGAGGEDSPGAVRVVLVVGSGGLGKSTLAVHAAHLLASQFPDGQLYANLLGATQPVAAAEVLARFLRDLGMDGPRIPMDEEERATHFRTRLAGKRMLIVLDDARDAAQVQPLLPGTASCSVLVTARGMLPELVGSKVIDLDVLPRSEARVLFSVVAGEGRADAEPAATEAVLSACAGLPLAVRIVGARLARRGGGTVQALADRLSDERRRLDELRMGNLAVRASFEVSFAALPGAGRPGELDPARAFRLLGLWTGPSIGLTAASSLLGEPEGAAADALSVLVDAHLLESPELDRYRFHDLLRVYAADRALTEESEADRREAINRVLAWYLHTAEAAARVISSQRRQVPLGQVPPELHPLAFATLEEALAWCEHERPELIAATRLAAASGLHDLAWKLPAAAMVFYSRRSHWADWVAAHKIGLASAQAVGERLAEAWMLNNLGMAYGVQRLPESLACFEQALALSRELGNGPGEAQAVTNIANTYFRLGNFAEARGAALRSLDIERKVGDRFGEGIALGILGSACRELGGYDEAIHYLQQALDISRELGDRDGEAECLKDLGEAYLGLGRMKDAIGRMEDALAIWESIGDRYGQAATLQRLGQAQLRAGEAGKARALLAQAIDLYDDLQDHAQASAVRAELSAMTRRTG